MKTAEDARQILALAPLQRGVFSVSDLRTALPDPHPASFTRRTAWLQRAGVLRRFLRGWYVAEEFDLPTLSQRLSPESYVSFANVLSRDLLIGPRPERQVMAVRVGRNRTYRAFGFEIVHLGIAAHLFFGYEAREGVCFAEAEKAVLDTLYFHLRGQRYVFDPFSDVDTSRLDPARLRDYLRRYRNPRFVTFARDVLGMS